MELTTKLSGRVALVTGATRGIGLAISQRLAASGADVAVGYGRDRDLGEKRADEIRGMGRRAVAAGGDLADPTRVTTVVDTAEGALGPIDVLVCNAGIAPAQDFTQIRSEEWDRVMNVNLRAAFLLAQRTIPGMRERRYGRVVFVSSVAAFTGGIVGPHYAASKAGMLGLTHSLARPLAPHGVTVNAVVPALVDEGGTLPGDEEDRRRLAERVPVERLGRPEEVAEAVLFLVSNSFVTSQAISVDGGTYPR